MHKLLSGLAVLGTIVATPASALVRYDFTALSSLDFGDGHGSATGGWTYVAATFVPGDAIIAAADLASCTVVSSIGSATCTDQRFFKAPAVGQPDTVAIEFGTTFVAPVYYFADGAFTTPGTHSSTHFGAEQQGVLVVTEIAVPEPASWALMIAGFGLVGATMRRRVARTA